jgi:hypothetical protein
MDEVLGFRSEHKQEYRSYSRALRRFVRELSPLPELERRAALNDRRAEIREMARELQALGTKTWSTQAAFALSLTGAIWTLHTGDPVGAALAFASAGLSAMGNPTSEVGAYSYLFKAGKL